MYVLCTIALYTIASPAWLGWHTRQMDIRKLTSLHYRLLRTAVCDYKSSINRDKLDILGRVRPSLQARYSTASVTKKILRNSCPQRLYNHLMGNMYRETRTKRIKFYDQSRLRLGRQVLANRFKHIFDEMTNELTLRESNNSLRLLLKCAFEFSINEDHNFPGGQKLQPSKGTPQIVNLQTMM